MKKVEEILNNLPKVAMTDGEKARIRGALSARMHAMPRKATPSPYAKFFGSRSLTARSFQAIAVLFFAICGSVSVAAQGALPGDPLYSVKVNVNEPVSGAFAFTAQAKAEHESSLAAARIQEASDLSAEGKLTPETRTQIAANLKIHVDNVQKSVTELESEDNVKGAVEVNSDLVSTLQGNEKVLIDLDGGTSASSSAASSVSQQVSAVSERLALLESQVTSDTEPSADAEAQAQDKSIQAGSQLTLAKDAFAAATDTSESASTDIGNRIRTASGYLAAGYANVKSGSYNKAFISFQTSIRLSKEALSMLKDGADAGQGIDATTSLDSDSTASSTDATTTEGDNATTTMTTIATTTEAVGSTTLSGTASGTVDTKKIEPVAKPGIIGHILKLGL